MMDSSIETTDLYLGALWYAKDMKFSGVRREGRQCWFVFDNVTDSREIESRYYSGGETVNARDFVNAIRTLKELIFKQH